MFLLGGRLLLKIFGFDLFIYLISTAYKYKMTARQLHVGVRRKNVLLVRAGSTNPIHRRRHLQVEVVDTTREAGQLPLIVFVLLHQLQHTNYLGKIVDGLPFGHQRRVCGPVGERTFPSGTSDTANRTRTADVEVAREFIFSE